MDEIARIRKAYEGRIEQGVIDRYSLFFPGELYMLQRREEETLRLLARHGLTSLRDLTILDVGCGRGTRFIDWMRWGALPSSIYGIDLLEPFIKEARQNVPGSHVAVGAADHLPFPAGSFDLVVQSTVFTSILDPSLKEAVASEMARILRPNGFILWYDFRYPSFFNRNVRPIKLAELKSLFPGRQIVWRSLTLLPPIARKLAPVSMSACRVLESSMPLLRSHYLALIGGAPA
ncbi:MAG TPA: class I SAM-dependent methyltransferase [Pseudolabrys sp.]|jgi:ubiquinone/menaquinone biosynthesis C-methylase UbiE|nr:class I SAM-dependent methyltransferase [Pseudolabrys sp.]